MFEKEPINSPEETSEEDTEELKRFQKECDEKINNKIKESHGEEMLNTLEHLTDAFDQTVKSQVLAIKDPKEAERVLGLWNHFLTRVYQRLHAENIRDPEMVKTALKTATAMIQPEEDKEAAKAAKQGIDLLQNRYRNYPE